MYLHVYTRVFACDRDGVRKMMEGDWRRRGGACECKCDWVSVRVCLK